MRQFSLKLGNLHGMKFGKYVIKICMEDYGIWLYLVSSQYLTGQVNARVNYTLVYILYNIGTNLEEV